MSSNSKKRRPIGFCIPEDYEETSEQVSNVVEVQEPIDVDILLQQRGYAMATEIMQQYLNQKNMPFVRGAERDTWLADKMRRIKERYFDKI